MQIGRPARRSIVNHFRCAHQAMERQFTKGETLICPKCRQRLRHFGVDYDRPGTATVCRACGHVDAEATIGFLCIDCGARKDAAVVPTRDWYAYASDGRRRAPSAEWRSPHAAKQRRDGVGGVPHPFGALDAHTVPLRPSGDHAPSRLHARSGGARKEGPRVLALAIRQAVEIVRGELRATDFMTETPEGMLIVLPETDARAADVPRRRLLDRIASMLAVDLGVDIAVVAPRKLLAEHDVPAMRHPVSSCESLVVRDGGVMQLLVVEGAIVPGAPKDAYPGAGEDANGMGMIAASAASALVDVCCPRGCVSGVVGEAGDGPSQAMVACPAEDDTAALAGGVGDRADAGFGGEVVGAREALAHIAELGEDCAAQMRPSLGRT